MLLMLMKQLETRDEEEVPPELRRVSACDRGQEVPGRRRCSAAYPATEIVIEAVGRPRELDQEVRHRELL